MVSASEGWEGYVRIQSQAQWDAGPGVWSNATEPYLTSAPFDTDVAMERIYVIGSRTPADTTEGVMEISGSIDRPFFESAARNEIILVVGDTQKTLAQTCGIYGGNVSACCMLVQPSSNQTFVLHDVKFHSYSLSFAQGEVTGEHCDFTADNISTS